MGADQRLVSYIQEQLKRGYDINAVREYLINYGYDRNAVESAIGHIYKQKFPAVPIAIGGAIVVGIIGVILFFMLRSGVPDNLLDVETSIVSREVRQGGIIEFKTELTNMGAANRYDVTLNHEIVDSSGRMLTNKKERVGVETKASKISQLLIIDTIMPGSYTLKTTAEYDGKSADASFMFNVKAREGVSSGAGTTDGGELPVTNAGECPSSCDDFNECTRDYCSPETNYECVHEQITPCCGNRVCETREDYSSCASDCAYVAPPSGTVPMTFDEIVRTAKEKSINPAQAAAFCQSLATDVHRDICFNTVAETTGSSTYCSNVISDVSRDGCYTNFVLAGDLTLCDKLTNPHLKSACEGMAEANR